MPWFVRWLPPPLLQEMLIMAVGAARGTGERGRFLWEIVDKLTWVDVHGNRTDDLGQNAVGLVTTAIGKSFRERIVSKMLINSP